MIITKEILKGTDGDITLKLSSNDKYYIATADGKTIEPTFKKIINKDHVEEKILINGFLSCFIQDKYHRGKNRKPLSNQTIKNYYNHVKLFIDWLDIGITAGNLETVFNDYSEYLIKENKKYSTHNTYMMAVYELFSNNKIMKALGLSEPVKPILFNEDINNNDEKDYIEAFSTKTFNQIINSIPEDNKKYIALAKILGGAGLRVNELHELKKADICFKVDVTNPKNNIPVPLDKNGLFIIPETIPNETGLIYIYVRNGKGNKSRKVELDLGNDDPLDTLISINEMIRARIYNPATNRILRNNLKKELNTDYVFKNRSFKKLSVTIIQRNIKSIGLNCIKYLQDNNVPATDIDMETLSNLHPHLFRHYRASYDVNILKIPISVEMFRLGHSSSSTTELYILPNDDVRNDAIIKALKKD